MKTAMHPFFTAVLLSLLMPLNLAAQDDAAQAVPHLPIIKNLRDELRLAEQRELPILILFSMEDCEYCSFVRQQYLLPRLRNPDYADKIIIREIQTESFRYLRDEQGRIVDADELAARYQADLIPTLVIIDDAGRPLVKNIIGITNRSYYDVELDARIHDAYKKMRSDS